VSTPPEPPTASPTSPRPETSARVPGVAAGPQRKGAHAARTPPSGARVEGCGAFGRAVALLGWQSRRICPWRVMAPLPMRGLLEQVVRCPRAEAVRLTGPTELDLPWPDQAQLVMCDHTIEQDQRGVKRITRPMLGLSRSTRPSVPSRGSSLCRCYGKATGRRSRTGPNAGQTVLLSGRVIPSLAKHSTLTFLVPVSSFERL